MKNKLSKYLSQPAPYINDTPRYTMLLCIAIVIFVLYVFEPFGMNMARKGSLIVLSLIITVVLLCLGIFSFILPLIFKRFFNPDKWTLGKTLLFYFLLLVAIGLGISLVDYILYHDVSPRKYTQTIYLYIFSSFAIGIIPSITSTFITYYRALKRNLDSALKINKVLSEQVKQYHTALESITIISSTKEHLKVNPTDILYIESTGNYVNIHYVSEGRILGKMLRTTIKQVEELMNSQGDFIRCHRAFIVNISYVYNVSGNAQGLKLAIRETDIQIPVSRSYIRAINDVFESRNISK